MPGIQRVAGRAVALDRRDVDTDQIIPASWLKRVERTGFAPGLFGAWREDPEFVLNRPGAAEAKVLVAGANFGCGSSREHAVWALQDFGFQAVVAPSFGDIFRSNCVRNGVLTAVIDPAARLRVHEYLVAHPGAELTIDVAAATVAPVGEPVVGEPVTIDGFARRVLVDRVDEFSLLLDLAERTDATLGPAPDTRRTA
jgi:3-isopropylmalate/(R)-2-methylmalate dehydratase small subunit